MEEEYTILKVTKVGKYYRTTIPEEVRRILDIGEGDEVVWIKLGDKIIIEKARKKLRKVK